MLKLKKKKKGGGEGNRFIKMLIIFFFVILFFFVVYFGILFVYNNFSCYNRLILRCERFIIIGVYLLFMVRVMFFEGI